jgi:hypothetical protein
MASIKKAKKGAVVAGPDFDKRNYTILGAGIILIVLGFILLATGDITISPILLVLGYCVVIPLGMLLPKKSDTPGLDVDKNNVVSS